MSGRDSGGGVSHLNTPSHLNMPRSDAIFPATRNTRKRLWMVDSGVRMKFSGLRRASVPLRSLSLVSPRSLVTGSSSSLCEAFPADQNESHDLETRDSAAACSADGLGQQACFGDLNPTTCFDELLEARGVARGTIRSRTCSSHLLSRAMCREGVHSSFRLYIHQPAGSAPELCPEILYSQAKRKVGFELTDSSCPQPHDIHVAIEYA